MGKMHITESLVCENCIESSPTNGCGKHIRICHRTGKYVHARTIFCNYFVADWVIDDQNDLFERSLYERGVKEFVELYERKR